LADSSREGVNRLICLIHHCAIEVKYANMGHLKTYSVLVIEWVFLIYLVNVSSTSQFLEHSAVTTSASFALTTIVTSKDVFVTFTNDSRTSVDFLSLNKSIKNPDLSIISASISMQYLKSTWNTQLCAKKSHDNSIIKLTAQLTTLDDVYKQIERASRGINDKVDEVPVGDNCTNKLDSACDDYGDFFSDVANETSPATLYSDVEIPLEFTCKVEDDGTKIEIQIVPILHKWFEEFEICKKLNSSKEKDEANLEKLAFRLFVAFDQLDIEKDKKDGTTFSELHAYVISDISLRITYLIDRK